MTHRALQRAAFGGGSLKEMLMGGTAAGFCAVVLRAALMAVSNWVVGIRVMRGFIQLSTPLPRQDFNECARR
jgi:type IV secretory pathway TrbD component